MVHSDDPAVLLPHRERELLKPEVRRDPAQVGRLLADDFREFGSSGRVWSRAEILEDLAGEVPGHLEASDFEVKLLTPQLALVTYRSTRFRDGVPPRHAMRSSLWRMEGGEWRIFFHQGTLVPI